MQLAKDINLWFMKIHLMAYAGKKKELIYIYQQLIDGNISVIRGDSRRRATEKKT